MLLSMSSIERLEVPIIVLQCMSFQRWNQRRGIDQRAQ